MASEGDETVGAELRHAVASRQERRIERDLAQLLGHVAARDPQSIRAVREVDRERPRRERALELLLEKRRHLLGVPGSSDA